MEWIYELLLDFSLLWMIGYVRKYRCKEKEQIFGEQNLDTKIAEIAAAYSKYHNVEEALFEVEAKNPKSYKKRQQSLKSAYEILVEKLCQTVIQIGDRRKNGASVFQKNLYEIRDEVREHILLQQNQYYLFLGLRPLCMVPFFLIPVLTWWAIHISEQLAQYYSGRFAILTTTFAYLVTVAGYFFVSWLELPELVKNSQYRLEKKLLKVPLISHWLDQKMQRNYGSYLKKNELLKTLQGFGNIKEFELRKRCLFLAGVVGGCLFFLVFTDVSRKGITKQLLFPEMYTLSMEQEQIQELNEILQVEFKKVQQGRATVEEASQSFMEYPKEVQEAVQLLYSQLFEKWEQTHFHLLYVLISIGIGVGGFFFPELLLVVRSWHVAEEKMEEVQRFLIVILVQIQDQEVTVEQLLEALEAHASLFRSAMEEAVDHFSLDRKGSVERLIEQTAYEPMERICENLYLCEEVGVEEAFTGLEEERKYQLRKNMQERNAKLRERVALAKAVAYLPFLTVLLWKLIIPFVAEGLSQLSLYGQGIQRFF